MIKTIISLFCFLLYIALEMHILSPIAIYTISTLSIVYALTVLLYLQYMAITHPLQKRISQALLAYKKNTGQSCHHFQIVLNLSQEPLFQKEQHDCFKMLYKNCSLHGYIVKNIFYLSITHPNNQLSIIADLWLEIGKCYIKFNDFCLSINIEQLETIEKRLEEEWLYLFFLLQDAPFVSLLLNDKSIAQSLYYAKEYGHIPSYIKIAPFQKMLTILHQSNQQLDLLVQKLFTKRNELCIHPPINQETQTQVFQISYRLIDIKPLLLNTVASFTTSDIAIHSICLGLNEFIDPTLHIKNHHYLPHFALMLSFAAVAIYTTSQFIQHNIRYTLEKSNTGQLAHQLYALHDYPQFNHIQNDYLTKLKEEIIAENQNKHVYHYLLSHYNHSSPELKYHIIHQLTEQKFSKKITSFLSKHWFTPTSAPKPSLSEVSMVIDTPYIQDICTVFEPNQIDGCIGSLSKIKTYQLYQQKLQNIEKTLLPMHPENFDQTIRQLTYLAQHPKHIGEEALRHLDKMIINLSKEGHHTLIHQAKEIQSIIHLLKSPQGQHLLQKIKVLYILHHQITSNEEAHHVLQKAYSSDHHVLREIMILKHHLAPHQVKWLDCITYPLIKDMTDKANIFLKTTWNQNIYPELQLIQAKYPFSDSQENTSSEEVFIAIKLIEEYFDRYIRLFVQEEDGELVIKPYHLDIHIPDNILALYIYTKVFNSSLDIKQNHLHSAWAIHLKDQPHPITSITLHSANKTTPLKTHKGTTLHWDSRYPVGFDVHLQNGDIISIIENNDWSILHLIERFKKVRSQQFVYTHPEQSWSFSIDIKPQYPVDLLNTDILQSIPFSSWQ